MGRRGGRRRRRAVAEWRRSAAEGVGGMVGEFLCVLRCAGGCRGGVCGVPELKIGGLWFVGFGIGGVIGEKRAVVLHRQR